jgi:hypothetical protein
MPRLKNGSLVEQRILEKVHPIKGPSRELPETTQLPQLPHNHQKGVQCRSCRLLRKIEKDRRRENLESQLASGAKEATVGIGTVLVYGLAEIVKEGIGGTFKIGEAIARNEDPVAQGVAILGGVAAFEWFVASFPEIATFFHMDTFPGTLSQNLPPTDNARGGFGIQFFFIPGANQRYINGLGGVQVAAGSTILAWDQITDRDNAYSIASNGIWQLLHRVAAIAQVNREVLPGKDGPYPTQDEALLDVSSLAVKNIASSITHDSTGYYVVYSPYVGPWH